MEEKYFIQKGYWQGRIITWERLDTNYSLFQGWKSFVHLSIMHQTSFWGGRNIVQENDRAHLKTRGSFLKKSITRCTFLQHDSHMHLKSQRGIQKNCVSKFPVLSALKSPSCRLVVFIDMNTNILTEGRNFKTFLKENYAIALDSCCLFTKEMLNMELNIILVVLLEFAYIRDAWNMQIWWILSRWWIWQSVNINL